MTIGDVIRITLCQTYSNQEICNIFAYVVDNLTGNVTLEDIVDDFVAFILDQLNVIQAQGLTNDRLIIENLTNAVDFWEADLSGTGDSTEEGTSVFTAMAFRYNRTSKVTRNGFKRFGGISSEYSASPNAWFTGDTDILTIETALESTLVVDADGGGGQASLTPIILGRTASGNPDINRFQRVSSVTFQPQKTTQNSRKIGSGN